MALKSADQPHPGGKRAFSRRYYSSWPSFWKDLSYLLSHRDQIKAAMSSPLIDPAFRERLMLAVTEVNLCRYCRTFHVGQAKGAGIPITEITEYLKGSIPEDVPEAQKLAVCYARHWAESEAEPDADYVEQVRESYGEDGYQAIHMVLNMIRMGNLLGNTVDYLLFRISFGRWGQNSSPQGAI